MVKVLFVCLGNICRSPLAEALFRKHVSHLGLSDKYDCDSCGTADFNIGSLPDHRSVKNANLNGLEYTHKARQLSLRDFKEFDVILAMDESNYANVMFMNRINHNYIYKIRDFDSIDNGTDVPDPYFGGSDGFQKVYEILDRSTLHLLQELLKPKYLENVLSK